MPIQKTILWYDLETFGLNPRVDRIAQCAMIRTDLALNIIEDPIILYNRMTDDYLPTPESCMITHITPQEVNEKGMREFDFIDRINREMLRPGTITAGFNNMNFDDECIRATLYRNLFDPYERENRMERSRWDIMNLVRACADLRPYGIRFDKRNETGAPSCKLTDITEQNGIEQVGAHDACVDVYATIAVAKLIKQKQPKLYMWAFEHRFKQKVWDVIDVERHTPILFTHPMFVTEKGNTHPVIPLWRNKEKSNDIWGFDLTKPVPKSLEEVTDIRESGFVRIATNKCPFVAPMNVLDVDSELRLGFSREEAELKARMIVQRCPYMFDLSPLMETLSYEKETDPDYTIYDSFLSPRDKQTLRMLNAKSPLEKLAGGEYNMDDPKYHKLLWRQVARNWPEALSEKERLQWKNFCAGRLINPPSKFSQTMEVYMRSCEDGLNSLETTAEEKQIYLALKNWGLELQQRILS